MIRVVTQNSVYEVDQDKQLIRLVEGTPTPRFKERCEWRPYSDLLLHEGRSMVVLWDVVRDDDGVVSKTTITSAVERIERSDVE